MITPITQAAQVVEQFTWGRDLGCLRDEHMEEKEIFMNKFNKPDESGEPIDMPKLCS